MNAVATLDDPPVSVQSTQKSVPRLALEVSARKRRRSPDHLNSEKIKLQQFIIAYRRIYNNRAERNESLETIDILVELSQSVDGESTLTIFDLQVLYRSALINTQKITIES